MERVGAVVGDQAEGLAAQGELRAADPVGIATGDSTKMAGKRLVVPQVSQTERDVVEPAGAVGYLDLGDDAAITQKSHTQPMVVGQREEVDRLPALRGAIGLAVECRCGASHGVGDRGCNYHGDRKRPVRGGSGLAAATEACIVGEADHDVSFPCRLFRRPAAGPMIWDVARAV